MALEWDWPKRWDPTFIRSLQDELQTRLREAMGKNQSPQLRGAVVVDALNLGSAPPDIAVKEIMHIGAASTKLEIWFRYRGDASITLKGLEINLDSTSTGDTTDDGPNHLAPFFCPFEMTMHSIRLEGSVIVELKHLIVRGKGKSGTGRFPDEPARPNSPPLLPFHAMQHSAPTVAPARPAPTVPRTPELAHHSPSRGTGVGILLSAGGRAHMRPARIDSQHGAVQPPSASSSSSSLRGASQSQTTPPVTFYDLSVGHAQCVGRRLKFQLLDDPLKAFSIKSNFDSLGAQKTVEATLRLVFLPVIEYLKNTGLTLTLPVEVPPHSAGEKDLGGRGDAAGHAHGTDRPGQRRESTLSAATQSEVGDAAFY